VLLSFYFFSTIPYVKLKELHQRKKTTKSAKPTPKYTVTKKKDTFRDKQIWIQSVTKLMHGFDFKIWIQ